MRLVDFRLRPCRLHREVDVTYFDRVSYVPFRYIVFISKLIL